MIPPVCSNTNGDSFRLNILGYESADPQRDDYDWLMVGIHACAAGRCWDARFPCLQWDEATELAAWLEESSGGEPEPTEIRFTEPNLWFEYLSARSAGVRSRVLWTSSPRQLGSTVPTSIAMLPGPWGSPYPAWTAKRRGSMGAAGH